MHRNNMMLILLFLLPGIEGIAQQKHELTLLFAGDLMQHDAQLDAAYRADSRSYDYDSYFLFVKPLIQSADIAIANLEVTLGGKPYTGYPRFSAPDAYAKAAVDAGFHVLLTANNHTCDRDKKGIVRTLDVLDQLQVHHTGTYRNKTERDSTNPLILEKNGIKLAMLNYTYGLNGNTVPPPTIVNLIDTNIIINDLKQAQLKQADLIIVTMHWGQEYQRTQNKGQEDLAKLCFTHGADIIIGSHPHVIEPMYAGPASKFKGPVYFSLGNFISNQRRRYTNGGAMAWLKISKQNNIVSIDTSAYLLNWVWVNKTSSGEDFYILPDLNEYVYAGDTLNIQAEDQKKKDLFFRDSRELLGTHNIGIFEIKASELNRKKAIIPASTFIYSIQLFASVSPDKQDRIPADWRNQLFIDPNEAGIYRYRIGKYFSKTIALAMLNKFRQAGFSDAFLIKKEKID